MSLLALIAAGQSPTPPTPPTYPALPVVSEAATPAWSTSAPYTRHRLIVNTYDGSGSTLHPGVVDMVAETGAPFRGYRYWMVHTPFPLQDGTKENPSIVVSRDGYQWHDSAVGITNPVVAPVPPAVNSDADLAWNPEAHRFEMIYPVNHGGGSAMWHVHSSDGVTWSARTQVFPLTPYTRGMSPLLIRLAPYHWRLIVHNGETNKLQWRDASYPQGPYTPPADCVTLNEAGAPAWPSLWHGDAIRLPDGTLYGLWTARGYNITPGVSIDGGLTWTFSDTALPLDNVSGYRPTLAMDDDPGWVRVWDSRSIDIGIGATHYLHVTRVPVSAWTNLL